MERWSCSWRLPGRTAQQKLTHNSPACGHGQLVLQTAVSDCQRGFLASMCMWIKAVFHVLDSSWENVQFKSGVNIPRPSFPRSLLGSSKPSFLFPYERLFPPVQSSSGSYRDPSPCSGQPYPNNISWVGTSTAKLSKDYEIKTSSLHAVLQSYLVQKPGGR